MFGVGWFANEALQTQRIYAAAKPLEYKVVPVSTNYFRENFEKTANTYAQQGWRVHSWIVEGILFER